ncbi:MAG TPA: 23S rRNA (adenine(2503)-C(2))-methyltransferase RlmN [Spirochaetia bacterium]|nr:23S rRNA (adenine(2503)-C(2))-methyltransferase RlmN [Spirochaetia bacterium]
MPPSPRPSFHDLSAVKTSLVGVPGGREALTQLVRDLYRDRLGWDAALDRAPSAVSHLVGSTFCWTSTTISGTREAPDGSTKAVFRTTDGLGFEAVLIRHPNRATLCLSCQVGCPLGCAFCATGRQGLIRDLTVGEILDQAVWAVETLAREGRSLRNVVFMGMGEPLLALEVVGPALEALLDQRRFGIAPRFVSVSTSGITPAIEPFWRAFPRVKLAVSLHAARQDLRDRLMPGCRPWPLDGLMEALDRYQGATGHRLFFEYVMIAGVNDGQDERSELISLLAGRDAHVNLIPYNPSDGEAWRPSPRDVLDRFQRDLGAAGVVTTVRNSAGDAITAACGQLAGPELSLGPTP